jgi:GTP-binding nuclear protein Ran
MQNYKIVIIGNPKSGKSSYIKRLMNGDYNKKYIPTLGVEVHILPIYTQKGEIAFNVWDCAGDEKFGGLKEGYYNESSGALLFCTGENDEKWADLYRSKCNTPILRVWGKIDNSPSPTTVDHNISSRSCTNLDDPIFHLARLITNQDLYKTETLRVITPPVVKFTQKTIENQIQQ